MLHICRRMLRETDKRGTMEVVKIMHDAENQVRA
jgi:hypothetical protein